MLLGAPVVIVVEKCDRVRYDDRAFAAIRPGSDYCPFSFQECVVDSRFVNMIASMLTVDRSGPLSLNEKLESIILERRCRLTTISKTGKT